jgi:hypothetical protein
MSVVWHWIFIEIEPQIPPEELTIMARYIILPNKLRYCLIYKNVSFENVKVTDGMVGIVSNHS